MKNDNARGRLQRYVRAVAAGQQVTPYALMCDLYARCGCSAKRVASTFDIPAEAVFKYCRQLGVDMRAISKYCKPGESEIVESLHKHGSIGKLVRDTGCSLRAVSNIILKYRICADSRDHFTIEGVPGIFTLPALCKYFGMDYGYYQKHHNRNPGKFESLTDCVFHYMHEFGVTKISVLGLNLDYVKQQRALALEACNGKVR